jgi:putative membrane protein
MKLISYLALVLGLAVAIVLVAWHGFETVAAAMATLGAGMLVLPFVYAPHILGAAISWSQIFLPGTRPAFPVTLRAVWIGLSAESMVPGASFGAEIAKARMLMRAGMHGRDAASSVVVDMTIQGLVLAVWGALGVAALCSTQAGADLIWSGLVGACVLMLAVGGLIMAQRAGFFGLLAKQGGKAIRSARWQGVIDGASQLDAAIRRIYDQPGRIVLATVIRCCSRSMLMVELCLVGFLMGHPIAPSAAVMLIGLIGALRAAAFVVPGGWGVQEGGFVVLGGLIGLPPDIMLAMSLATRAREVMVGVPALVVWQIAEGRSLKNLIGERRADPSL